MEEQLKNIALRLRDLREIMNFPPEILAQKCGITTLQYYDYESGNVDIPVGILHRLAQTFGVELTSLLTGDEPHMSAYSLTRKGQGVAVERRRSYLYQSLASNFKHRKAEPFRVRVEPKPDTVELDFSSHPGQEFDMVLSGTLKIYLSGKEMILNEGDSLYFDSGLPHAMRAANNQPCEFLAVIF
jgi:quercetin dioxygenase-like cupin family protein